ncbi:MAG: hypothetical protein RHS_4770 [Robinsoniella sp. RHS]|nr:MAG: hypothetical protein RHS_4770 [Robinsoniella sp. RHS]
MQFTAVFSDICRIPSTILIASFIPAADFCRNICIIVFTVPEIIVGIRAVLGNFPVCIRIYYRTGSIVVGNYQFPQNPSFTGFIIRSKDSCEVGLICCLIPASPYGYSDSIVTVLHQICYVISLVIGIVFICCPPGIENIIYIRIYFPAIYVSLIYTHCSHIQPCRNNCFGTVQCHLFTKQRSRLISSPCVQPPGSVYASGSFKVRGIRYSGIAVLIRNGYRPVVSGGILQRSISAVWDSYRFGTVYFTAVPDNCSISTSLTYNNLVGSLCRTCIR